MRKRIFAAVLLLLLVAAQGITILAAPPSKSYTYDAEGMAVPSPLPYKYDEEIEGGSYGIGSFYEPEDMIIDSDYNVYVLDTGNLRICIFNQNKELIRVIKDIYYKGELLTMKGPQGLFIYEYFNKKLLYVSDTENNRIFRVDLADELDGTKVFDSIQVETMYTQPVIDIIKEDTPYYPTKFIVDRAERIFALCRTINRGIAKLTAEGQFDTFFGAPDVTYSFAVRILRLFSTKEQLKQQEQYVPTEYSNITTDSRGFVYTTTSNIDRQLLYASFWTEADDVAGRQSSAPVKKLAADGSDILTRTGIFPPVGDIAVYDPNAIEAVLAGMSSFADVCVNEYDVYTIIDDQRCKVFTYDADGNLLFVFGNVGTQYGTFTKPVAVAYFKEDQIVVLDKRTASVAFFKPTDYGKSILSAVSAYANGEYEYSEMMWKRVLEMNSNMMQAYSGVGKSNLRAGEFKTAMDNFKIARNTEYYSKALEEYINETIGDSFTWIFLVVVGIFLILWIWKIIKKFKVFLREGVKKVM